MSNSKSILLNQIKQLVGVENVELIMVKPNKPDYALCHVYFDPKSVVDRLTPEEVALRNYNATVKRGLINDETTFFDFVGKIQEERNELIHSFDIHYHGFDHSELADISLVCDAMALHYGIDLQAEKERKMKINETRND